MLCLAWLKETSPITCYNCHSNIPQYLDSIQSVPNCMNKCLITIPQLMIFKRDSTTYYQYKSNMFPKKHWTWFLYIMAASFNSFTNQFSDLSLVEFTDFENSWNVFKVFLSFPMDEVLQWMQSVGLLCPLTSCNKEIAGGVNCHKKVTFQKRTKSIDGYVWKCESSHETSVRSRSFFSRSHVLLPDLWNFLFHYSSKITLAECASFAAMNSSRTSVNWASMTRELFVENWYRHLRTTVLHGVVEIDESLFGRKVKYNRGNFSKGMYSIKINHSFNTVIPMISELCTRTTLVTLFNVKKCRWSDTFAQIHSINFDFHEFPVPVPQEISGGPHVLHCNTPSQTKHPNLVLSNVLKHNCL